MNKMVLKEANAKEVNKEVKMVVVVMAVGIIKGEGEELANSEVVVLEVGEPNNVEFESSQRWRN